MDIFIYIAVAIVALVIGAVVASLISKRSAKSQANTIVEKAKLEAEVLKNNEVLKGKEEGLAIKSESEKQANARLAKVQSSEAKLKQREIQLNQQQQELQRKKNETDSLKVNLDNQLAVLDDRKKEVDKMEMKVRDTLEHVSGLSAEEAKEKLIESLKDEAKTAAASYINDIMDDAKLTANKEAKRIIVTTIQRVATETAIENATFALWRPLLALRLSLTIPPRLSCSQALTLCAGRLRDWLSINWLPTAASILLASRRLLPRCASRLRTRLSRLVSARPSTWVSMASTPSSFVSLER